MAMVIKYLSHFYNFLSDSRDPRTKNLLFLNFIHLVFIEVFYLIFTLRVGPWFMKNRPPYNLRYFIRAQNALQVALNLYTFYEGCVIMCADDFELRCQPSDFSNSEGALRIVNVCYWFYFSRVIDLFDTVFYVLRKKDNQLSFLHIYHHSLVILWSSVAINYTVGGNAVFPGALNSFVHVFMYGYYFVASLGPEYKPYLWWKEHLTQLQIFQFVMISTHALQALFRDCAYPKGFTFMSLLQGIFFMYLFGKFYLDNYVTPKLKRKSN